MSSACFASTFEQSMNELQFVFVNLSSAACSKQALEIQSGCSEAGLHSACEAQWKLFCVLVAPASPAACHVNEYVNEYLP